MHVYIDISAVDLYRFKFQMLENHVEEVSMHVHFLQLSFP